jgi:hypothetical protein
VLNATVGLVAFLKSAVRMKGPDGASFVAVSGVTEAIPCVGLYVVFSPRLCHWTFIQRPLMPF